MEREEAKMILSTRCPGGDPAADARLEEVLVLMADDVELAEWFAAEQAMDAGMREALRTIEPPARLREAILAGAKVTEFPLPKRRNFYPVWLAVAAAVVLALGGLVWSWPTGGKQLSLAQFDAAVPVLTAAHEHAFASKEGKIDDVRAWLAAHGGAGDFVVPAGLVGRGAVGCEVTSVQGTRVSILCFHLGEGHTAHLYVLDRSQLADPPAAGAPVYGRTGEYVTASWSAGGRSYVLAQRESAGSLKEFL